MALLSPLFMKANSPACSNEARIYNKKRNANCLRSFFHSDSIIFQGPEAVPNLDQRTFLAMYYDVSSLPQCH